MVTPAVLSTLLAIFRRIGIENPIDEGKIQEIVANNIYFKRYQCISINTLFFIDSHARLQLSFLVICIQLSFDGELGPLTDDNVTSVVLAIEPLFIYCYMPILSFCYLLAMNKHTTAPIVIKSHL